MKFRLFRKNKKLKETVDVESGFAEICNRYESKLRELCVDWDELTKKWDLLFESLDERVRNETNETLLKTPHERATASGQVIISFTSVKKSIKKELKKLSKTLNKEQTKLLKAKAKTWLQEVLGASELSRGSRFLRNKHMSEFSRYQRKLNKLLKKKDKALKAASQKKRLEQIEHEKGEQEKNRVRETQLRLAEEVRLTCKTCRHTPAEREEQVRQLVSINSHLLGTMKDERRTRKRDERRTRTLKRVYRFGSSALVEMNSRQRERTQFFAPERCPECQFPFFGRYL
jgi:hypothetical protein